MLVIGSCDLPVSHEPRGQIQLIIGPMFSGKTTELMRRLKRYEVANHKCLIVKYAGDTRYDEENISTHDRQAMAAVKATSLSNLRTMSSDFRVIGIDEGQFGFPSILTLVPLSESVIKLSAVCMVCYAEAAYTKRRGQEKEVEVIGGADKYMAVCRTCYSQDDESPSKES